MSIFALDTSDNFFLGVFTDAHFVEKRGDKRHVGNRKHKILVDCFKALWKVNCFKFIAVSESTPGPFAINMATYVGYTVAGFWGSVVATVSVCLPALTLMILITRFFLLLRDNRYVKGLRTNRYVKGLIAGMRPVVVGMIGAAALLLMFPSSKEGASFIDGWSWVLFIGAMVASYKKVNPILLIVLSAILGIAIYWVPTII